MKEVIFLYFRYHFLSTACVSKAHFVCLVACFLLLVEKAVFKKAKNLVTHTVIHIKQVSFLTRLQQFLPYFLCFYLTCKLKN